MKINFFGVLLFATCVSIISSVIQTICNRRIEADIRKLAKKRQESDLIDKE